MPKRIRNIVIVTILILLGILVFNLLKPKNESSSLTKDKASHQTHSSDHNPLQPNSQRKSHLTKKDQDRPLSKQLSDVKHSVQDRVYRVKDLELDQTTETGRKNIVELVTFINSSNPYSQDPQAKEPHTYKSNQLQKEASLRVYSLKRLSSTLSGEALKEQLNSIIQGSQDQAIIRIAKQVLEAKEQGQDYFENVRNAVRTMPSPADTDTTHEGHEDHKGH